MNAAGTLRCPGCGGDARPDSVNCDWCGLALATMSCPACLGAMFIGTKHCPWCGTEGSQKTHDGTAAGSCPRCGVKMAGIKVGRTHLSECAKCGGLWVDTASFQQICEDREDQEEVLGAPAPVSEKHAINSQGAQRMYVPCPLCAKLMNRINFGSCSGVIIDWCKDHGTWFDNNELRQIVTFIQGGGLKKARAREKEKLKEEEQRLRREASKLAAGGVDYSDLRTSLNWRDDDNSLLDFFSATWKSLSK